MFTANFGRFAFYSKLCLGYPYVLLGLYKGLVE